MLKDHEPHEVVFLHLTQGVSLEEILDEVRSYGWGVQEQFDITRFYEAFVDLSSGRKREANILFSSLLQSTSELIAYYARIFEGVSRSE